MVLTKKDLSQIKGVVHGEVEKAVETLATVVNKSFNVVQKQIELLDKQIEHVGAKLNTLDAELKHINARLNTIEHDIAEIRRHFVYRDEFEDALHRIAAVEKKLDIQGNK